MTNSDDNIKWFHQHCSLTYNWLETAVPMVDIARFIIKHIKRLCLSHVSKKVKSDFFKILLEYSKENGNLVVFFIEPISTRLLNLIEDDEFNVDNFMTYHLFMPIDVPEQSSPLSNLLSKALRWQTTYQSIPRRFGQGNYKESMWNTQRIPLNRNLLMRKVYMLIPKWAQTLIGNGESPNGNFLVGLHVSIWGLPVWKRGL